MMSSRFLLLLVLAALPGLASAGTPYAAELAPGLRSRLETFAQTAGLVSRFTEHRHTPLKKKPVVVSGLVRIDHERGLSLAYDQARAPVLILDQKGLLLRHPDGREQAPPPEAAEDLRLLRALFAFDLDALKNAYALAATEGTDGAWTLVFTRRPESGAAYRELTLAGDASRLTRIVLAKTPNLRTEIELEPPQLGVRYTAEELARYFR
jgi:hypothetical protein